MKLPENTGHNGFFKHPLLMGENLTRPMATLRIVLVRAKMDWYFGQDVPRLRSSRGDFCCLWKAPGNRTCAIEPRRMNRIGPQPSTPSSRPDTFPFSDSRAKSSWC